MRWSGRWWETQSNNRIEDGDINDDINGDSRDYDYIYLLNYCLSFSAALV
jgi:hypothetical protein